MSTTYRASDYGRPLYRDPERGVVLGVCAGLAEYFDLNVGMLRVLALVALLTISIPTLIAYAIAGLLMKGKPLRYYGKTDEAAFWKSGNRQNG
jgi:phage shock protein C